MEIRAFLFTDTMTASNRGDKNPLFRMIYVQQFFLTTFKNGRHYWKPNKKWCKIATAYSPVKLDLSDNYLNVFLLEENIKMFGGCIVFKEEHFKEDKIPPSMEMFLYH